jgi:hypothetical protein
MQVVFVLHTFFQSTYSCWPLTVSLNVIFSSLFYNRCRMMNNGLFNYESRWSRKLLNPDPALKRENVTRETLA